MTQFAVQLIVQSVLPDASKLTDEGVKTLKSFDEKTMNPAANCVPFPAPMLMISPDLKRITMGDGVIYFESEFEGVRRTVHLNVATHDGAIPSIQGHSIGKWQGKTLVVDTTNFAFHSIGHGYGVPSSSKKHLTERLTLNADGTSLTYHFEVTDAEYLKAPRVGDVQWAFRPDQKFAPEKCSLENARRFIKG